MTVESDAEPANGSSTAFALRLALPVALAAFGVLVWRTSFLIDDAFISFRYARNWAETGVPAYNTGVTPPVEGYSNFLWVLLLRWAYGLGFALESTSNWLSIGFSVATIAWVHRFLRTTAGLGPWPVALGTLSLATFPPFVVWSTGGLETAALGFFAFGSFALLARKTQSADGAEGVRIGLVAGLCGLALALVRVEGFLWVLAVATCAWIADRAAPKGAAAKGRRYAVFFGVYLTGFATFLVWRHATYGEWMANTMHAKAGLNGDTVLRGIKTSASYLALFASPLLALGALPWSARGERRGIALGAAGMFLGFLGYNTLVGGDWMPFFRFLAPASPFLAVLLALAFAALRPGAAIAAAAASIALASLPLFGASVVPRGVREALYFRAFRRVGYETEQTRWQQGVDNLEERFVPLGKALGQIAQPGDALTFGAIGAIGYYSGMTMLDRNGLVDREVARRTVAGPSRSAGHDKQVPRAWFLPRNPTIFHAIFVQGELGPPGSKTYEMTLRNVERRVWGESEGEEPLFDACLPEVWPLEPADGIPEQSSLMILRATDDADAARRFWAERRRSW